MKEPIWTVGGTSCPAEVAPLSPLCSLVRHSTCSRGPRASLLSLAGEWGGSDIGHTLCPARRAAQEGSEFRERRGQSADSACSAPSASHLTACKFLLKALLLYSLAPAPDHDSFIYGVLKPLFLFNITYTPKIKHHSANLLTSPLENTEMLRKAAGHKGHIWFHLSETWRPGKPRGRSRVTGARDQGAAA